MEQVEESKSASPTTAAAAAKKEKEEEEEKSRSRRVHRLIDGSHDGTVTIPAGFSLPPSASHAIGTSAVHSSSGDDKPSRADVRPGQHHGHHAAASASAGASTGTGTGAGVVSKGKASKKGGAFLTSIVTDLDASVDESSIAGASADATPMSSAAGGGHSLEVSASTHAPST
jgi:hypothetical protein